MHNLEPASSYIHISGCRFKKRLLASESKNSQEENQSEVDRRKETGIEKDMMLAQDLQIKLEQLETYEFDYPKKPKTPAPNLQDSILTRVLPPFEQSSLSILHVAQYSTEYVVFCKNYSS